MNMATDPRDSFFRSLNQSTAQPPSAPVDISTPPNYVKGGPAAPQHAAPIYDTCEFCRLPVRPGESHGVVAQDAEGNPKLVCKIQRLQMVEEEIAATLPDSTLASMSRR
jgi:hypothetical protein